MLFPCVHKKKQNLVVLGWLPNYKGNTREWVFQTHSTSQLLQKNNLLWNLIGESLGAGRRICWQPCVVCQVFEKERKKPPPAPIFICNVRLSVLSDNTVYHFTEPPIHVKYTAATFRRLVHEKDTKYINISDFALGWSNQHIDWLFRV